MNVSIDLVLCFYDLISVDLFKKILFDFSHAFIYHILEFGCV